MFQKLFANGFVEKVRKEYDRHRIDTDVDNRIWRHKHRNSQKNGKTYFTRNTKIISTKNKKRKGEIYV